ncbi:MAG: ATP-binding cassette domain-containing protein [Proteobacteria bacterium]|nr:ATP-binding cassette domain-containing protein [Desulfobacula sp.]MBU4130221.1 ATP-binding cassette domain-containing protein [Pseudomonadota bacterium]
MTLPLIQFVDIKKSFGSNHVLKGVNLSIYQGDILAVIGKSGTGKSVLLKHIIGLVSQDSGELLIRGIPLHSMPRKEKLLFKNELSYMFQENALFDFLTVFDNIALPLAENCLYPKSIIEERVNTRMQQLGLGPIGGKFPFQLSGGMRKRVALARALVTDPKVVLFDEPTTGLDPIRKKKVHTMIEEYQRQFGFTAVIVSHDIPEIFDLAQHVAMLDEGKIVFQGTKEDILHTHTNIVNAFIRGEE